MIRIKQEIKLQTTLIYINTQILGWLTEVLMQKFQINGSIYK